jgi:hypothetical protein
MLRKLGVLGLDCAWIFLPAMLCEIAVFLHGISERGHSLRG